MGAVVAAVIAGCGDDDDPDTVDAAQSEQQIEQELSSAGDSDQVGVVPDDVKSETGAKFTCSGSVSGGGSAKVEGARRRPT